MDLMVLTDQELISLGCRLNGGTFGRDPARGTPTKLAKVAYVRDLAKAMNPDDPELAKTTLEGMARSVLAARKGTGGAATPPPQGSARPPQGEDPNAGGEPTMGAQGTIGLPDSTQMGEPVPGPTEPFSLGVNEPPLFGDPEPTQAAGGAQGAGDEETPEDEAPQGAAGTQGGKADTLEARVRELISEAMGEATDTAAEDIAQAIEDRLGDAVAAIRAEVVAREPRTIQLSAPNLPAIPLGDDLHPVFGKAFALLSLPKELRHGWALGLVGPMGSTKTTLSKKLAEALHAAGFGAVSCSADMTRGVFDGRILPIGDGRYVPSDLVRIAEASRANPTGRYIYSLDELDRSAPEVACTLHAAISNGGIHAEPRSFAGLDVYLEFGDLSFIAQMNTYGTGANMQYASASLQDGALMDRLLMLHVGHPFGLWARTMGADDLYQAPPQWVPVERTDAQLHEALRHAFTTLHEMAERCTAGGLERTISFRAILKARACLCAGFSWDDTLDTILAGWGDDERAQVLA